MAPDNGRQEAKKNASDQHDHHQFETQSVAHARSVTMRHREVSLVQVVRIGRHVEEQLLAQQGRVSERNRAAQRGKPNAFHWLYENWGSMGVVPFDQIVVGILAQSAARAADDS
jgi:hypothetical protein